jgi:hypothetical protein
MKNTELPTNEQTVYIPDFTIKQVVKFKVKKDADYIYATVKGIHFYESKIKYDLALWLGDGSVDDPERESRIYNVEVEFLEAV